MMFTISEKNKFNIPLSVPFISGNEWKYVKECLDTGWVSSVGSYVTRFEEVVADYVGSKYAVATVNGTAALHVGLVACGIERGDEVMVPTLTFIATVNAIKYCDASPIFMDCNSDTLCVDTAKVVEFIEDCTIQKEDGYSYNKKSGKRVKAVIPVHIFGHSVDIDCLTEVCVNRNIDIVEDATESIGSAYKGEKTGSFGKIGCFSFNGNKMITTGGGGMVVTDDEGIAKKVRHLTTQAKKDDFEYDHDEIGFNYRLTNIQAALGVAQMEKIDDYIKIKRKNADLYMDFLSGIEEVELVNEKPWMKSNYWLFAIKTLKGHKNKLMQYLLEKNIQVRPIWKLIHTLPMYNECEAYKIKSACDCYDVCINLPSSINITKEEIEYVVKCIKKYFNCT